VIPLRVFIAIELDEKIKDYIEEKKTNIKRYCIKGNFSHRENFHITLRFLGEQDYERIKIITEIMDKTASMAKPFTMNLGNLGSFNRGKDDILWIGVKNGEREIRELYDILQEQLLKAGFPKENKGFKPHITIGREVKLTDKEQLLHSISIDPLPIEVKGISLMESTRIQGRLCYIPIYRKAFEG